MFDSEICKYKIQLIYVFFPIGKTTKTWETKTGLVVCWLLITFLAEVICASYEALMAADWFQNY